MFKDSARLSVRADSPHMKVPKRIRTYDCYVTKCEKVDAQYMPNYKHTYAPCS